MAKNYREAVHNGTRAAGALIRAAGIQSELETRLGAVDVFQLIAEADLPLLVRPLKGILGAFVKDPAPGILVTTERPLSIQRFTAAHELGHWYLGHSPSLDDEDQILRRGALRNDVSTGFQETEADAFAIALLMPKWLILAHCSRQGWRASDLRRPEIAYQLSLRLGTSYEATCRTLARYNIVDSDALETLHAASPKELKVALLGSFKPNSYHGDVWQLTEKDSGISIHGTEKDHLIIHLDELGGSGYLWDLDALVDAGFEIESDETLSQDSDPNSVGSHNIRKVLSKPNITSPGLVEMCQSRPWDETDISAKVDYFYDFTGPERPGLTRAERRKILGED